METIGLNKLDHSSSEVNWRNIAQVGLSLGVVAFSGGNAVAEAPLKEISPVLKAQCRTQVFDASLPDTIQFTRSNSSNVEATLSAYDITPNCEKVLNRQTSAVVTPIGADGVPTTTKVIFSTKSENYQDITKSLNLPPNQLRKPVSFMVTFKNTIYWQDNKKENQIASFIYYQKKANSQIVPGVQ